MLLGYTGGFIIGFVPMALLCGLAAHRKMFVALPCGLIGLAACHLLGVIQFSIVSSRPFMDSLLLISLPYLIKDVASVLAAYYLALALRRAVPLLSKRKSTS